MAVPNPVFEVQQGPGLSSTPDDVEIDGTHYFSLMPFRWMLLSIQKDPKLLTDDFLSQFTNDQVTFEQTVWKDWLQLESHPPLDLKFVRQDWQWQSALEQQPDYAKGALLDAFLFPQKPWPFVKSNPNMNKTNFVNVFLFTHDKVMNREASFVSRELQPFVKQQLLIAAAKSPQSFYFEQALPDWDWDPNTNSARVVTPSKQPFGLLQPIQNLAGQHIPAKAGYLSVFDAPRGVTNVRYIGYGSFEYLATNRWRESTFPSAYSHSKFASSDFISLDHKLDLSHINISASQAEKLKMGHFGLYARVYFDVVDMACRDAQYNTLYKRTSLIYYAKIKKIDIYFLDNHEINSKPIESTVSTIEASDLPVGSVEEQPKPYVAPKGKPHPAATMNR